jgi:molybdopterin-guanine dinucleotide biosynthesis protein MobB
MSLIVSVVGRRNAGKTTLIERLVPALKSEGRRPLRVAVLKHDVHGFDMDREGKDTWRFSRAGADAVGIASPGRTAVLENAAAEVIPEGFLASLREPPDLLLVEGFKRRPYPKIEAVGPEPALFAPPRSPLLIASYGRGEPGSSWPLHFCEVEPLADLLFDLCDQPARDGVTGFVLAGGNSRRWGSDKAAALLGGEPLVRIATRNLSPFCARVFVVSRDPGIMRLVPGPARHLADACADVHPMGGLHTALARLETGYALISACDTPFLNPLLVRRLLVAAAGHAAAVCRRDGRLEPFCGVYSRTCLEPAAALIREGRLSLCALLDRVRTRVLGEDEVRACDPYGFSFRDLDSPQDLEQAQAWLEPTAQTPCATS